MTKKQLVAETNRKVPLLGNPKSKQTQAQRRNKAVPQKPPVEEAPPAKSEGEPSEIEQFVDLMLDEYTKRQRIFQRANSVSRHNLIERILLRLHSNQHVKQSLLAEVNLKYLVRQACETTLLSEIELVMFNELAEDFFKQYSQQTPAEKLGFHDTQLLVFCLCVLVKEQLHPSQDAAQFNGQVASPLLINIVQLQKHIWQSFPGLYELFKMLPSTLGLRARLSGGALHMRQLNRAYRNLQESEAPTNNVSEQPQHSLYQLDLNFTVDSILSSVPKYKPRQHKVHAVDNSYVQDQGQQCKIGQWILKGWLQGFQLNGSDSEMRETPEQIASLMTQHYYNELKSKMSPSLPPPAPPLKKPSPRISFTSAVIEHTKARLIQPQVPPALQLPLTLPHGSMVKIPRSQNSESSHYSRSFSPKINLMLPQQMIPQPVFKPLAVKPLAAIDHCKFEKRAPEAIDIKMFDSEIIESPINLPSNSPAVRTPVSIAQRGLNFNRLGTQLLNVEQSRRASVQISHEGSRQNSSSEERRQQQIKTWSFLENRAFQPKNYGNIQQPNPILLPANMLVCPRNKYARRSSHLSEDKSVDFTMLHQRNVMPSASLGSLSQRPSVEGSPRNSLKATHLSIMNSFREWNDTLTRDFK